MNDKSFTSIFLQQDKKNKDQQGSFNNLNLDSNDSIIEGQEYFAGGIAEKLLEEIHDEQDEFEIFFSTMFFMGILLIPLQIIFSDYIKPYDAKLIEIIQSYFIKIFQNSDIWLLSFEKYLNIFSDAKILTSVTIFFYLCFDPGVAFKTTIVAGTSTYIVYILKVIITDSRPYWITPNVIPGLCRLSFGCPSLDVFVGMVYSNYLLFCTSRAINSDDIIVNKGIEQIKFSEKIAWCMILLNIIVGITFILMGENFIYQILISFFYGFIMIRIVIVFNKDIDYYTNGSRFVLEISNMACLIALFVVSIMAIMASLIYEVIDKDFLIPRDWIVNISVNTIFNYFIVTLH